MPNLTVVIRFPLSATLERAVAARATSIYSILTTALSQYFQTDRHDAYQISTSGVSSAMIFAGH